MEVLHVIVVHLDRLVYRQSESGAAVPISAETMASSPEIELRDPVEGGTPRSGFPWPLEIPVPHLNQNENRLDNRPEHVARSLRHRLRHRINCEAIR